MIDSLNPVKMVAFGLIITALVEGGLLYLFVRHIVRHHRRRRGGSSR